MNIRLREVEPADLPIFFADQQDAVAVEMVMFRSRERPEFDQHWAKILANEACGKQTILADGQVAGNIVSWNSDGQREIGYWISRSFWGRGVATAAVTAFLQLEQTRPLHAGVAKHNAGSLRVLQKCGFTFLRDSDGEPVISDGTHLLLILEKRD